MSQIDKKRLILSWLWHQISSLETKKAADQTSNRRFICHLVGNENDPEGLKAKKHVKNFPKINVKQQQDNEALNFNLDKYMCVVFICFDLQKPDI